MKQDITHLGLAEQLILTMDLLRRRFKAGQKSTFACDLLRYFKHRGLGSHQKRIAHCERLLHIAGQALRGERIDGALADLGRASLKTGDAIVFNGMKGRVLDELPDSKLSIALVDGDLVQGDRIVRRADVLPLLPGTVRY